MNKGLQIFLLGILFLASGAVGYILEDVLLSEKQLKEPVVEQQVSEPIVQEPTVQEPILSTIPVIPTDGVTVPKRNTSGKYDFSVVAAVESSHQLKYIVYSDETCTNEVQGNLSGTFTNIPGVPSKTYYLRVQNIATGEFSEIRPVGGFVQLVMYQKITKPELEKLFNVDQEWSAAPKDFSLRIVSPLDIKVIGMKEGERGVAKCEDICMKIFNGIWTSVVVGNIYYDAQGRMNKLEIKVNY